MESKSDKAKLKAEKKKQKEELKWAKAEKKYGDEWLKKMAEKGGEGSGRDIAYREYVISGKDAHEYEVSGLCAIAVGLILSIVAFFIPGFIVSGTFFILFGVLEISNQRVSLLRRRLAIDEIYNLAKFANYDRLIEKLAERANAVAEKKEKSTKKGKTNA